MTICEIVLKLIGEIAPVGDSTIDDFRFQNLKKMTELIDLLLVEITFISNNYKHRHEFSVKRAALYCEKFLNQLKET